MKRGLKVTCSYWLRRVRLSSADATTGVKRKDASNTRSSFVDVVETWTQESIFPIFSQNMHFREKYQVTKNIPHKIPYKNDPYENLNRGNFDEVTALWKWRKHEENLSDCWMWENRFRIRENFSWFEGKIQRRLRIWRQLWPYGLLGSASEWRFPELRHSLCLLYFRSTFRVL